MQNACFHMVIQETIYKLSQYNGPNLSCHPEDEDSVSTFTLLWLQDDDILTSPVL